MDVLILASGDCPHCQAICGALRERFRGRADVRCRVVDTAQDPAAVARYGYATSPVVVADGRVVAVGDEAVHALLEAGPAGNL